MAIRMKDIDLKHKIIEYFLEKADSYKTFPQSFTPTMIGDNIGAYIPRIGSVADAVIKELQGRGIDIEYKKEGNKKEFCHEWPQVIRMPVTLKSHNYAE